MQRALWLGVLLLAACAGQKKDPEFWGPQPAANAPITNTGGGSAPSSPVAPSGGGGDRDGDGVVDATDQCPDDPEDFDGFTDADGCPDPDNDRDGVPDVDDLCPNDPEDKDGNQDTDGCPEP